jgi:hypothetical protein
LRPLVTLLVLLAASAAGWSAERGHPGGPPPANLDPFFERLREQDYQLELLISFGTSKGGSAGHLALAIRDRAPGDDLVYSANFYADRSPEHATGYYNRELMCRIPKKEYLYGTRSSLGPDASFGLDFGEVYKRAVIGIRISGVPAAETTALAAFFEQMNRDFHARAPSTAYHPREITYDYMDLNCAKTIAVAFRYGLGWRDVAIRGEGLSGLHLVRALKANIPTETALAIMAAAQARGRTMEVLLYKKYPHSTYVNPKDEGGTMYQDLPNRFPSVLSTDYRMDQGRYEDYDNLYAMQLLYNLGRHAIVLDPASGELAFERSKEPMGYAQAAREADQRASADSKLLLRRILFRAWGIRLGDGVDNDPLYGGPSEAPVSFDDLVGPRK